MFIGVSPVWGEEYLGGGIPLILNGQTALPGGATFTRAANATLFNTAGTQTTVLNNVARFDNFPTTLLPRGLLVEGGRTQSIRNGDATGAVVGTIGSGGALPTNWSNNSGGGLTREVVSTGTVNGIPVVRLRFSGTATSSSAIAFFAESNTQVVAASGQTWTGSMYVRLVAGSLPSPNIAITERDSGGTTLQTSTNSISPTSNIERYTLTRTFTNASTAYAQVDFRVTLVNGVSYDFTIEIGEYQLEQGPFASSYMPTTSGTFIRTRDIVTFPNLATLGYNATEGTILVEYEHQGVSGNQFLATFDDGSTSNRMYVGVASGTTSAVVQTGGVTQANLTLNASTAANTVYRAAFAWKANDFAACLNGGSVVTDTSGTLPTVTTFRIGDNSSGAATAFTWFRSVIYYPFRVPDAKLPELRA